VTTVKLFYCAAYETPVFFLRRAAIRFIFKREQTEIKEVGRTQDAKVRATKVFFVKLYSSLRSWISVLRFVKCNYVSSLWTFLKFIVAFDVLLSCNWWPIVLGSGSYFIFELESVREGLVNRKAQHSLIQHLNSPFLGSDVLFSMVYSFRQIPRCSRVTFWNQVYGLQIEEATFTYGE
jgi:hypothetical protein